MSLAMTRRSLAAATFIILMLDAPGAVALSCLPPNPARELDGLLREGRDMVLVHGTASRLSASPHAGGPATGRFRISGEGVTLVDSGPMTVDVEITATCSGPWCAELPKNETEGLFLVRRSSRTDELVTGPCGSGIYPAADATRMKDLATCIEQRGCSPEIIESMDYRPER